MLLRRRRRERERVVETIESIVTELGLCRNDALTGLLEVKERIERDGGVRREGEEKRAAAAGAFMRT